MTCHAEKFPDVGNVKVHKNPFRICARFTFLRFGLRETDLTE